MGNLWVCTRRSGVFRFDQKRSSITSYTTEQGLIGNSARDIVEDRIKTHPLRIKRVKKAFLPITRYNIKTVMDGIKNFPDKYLEDVS